MRSTRTTRAGWGGDYFFWLWAAVMSATNDAGGTVIVDLVRQEALEDAGIVVVVRIRCAATDGPTVAWERRVCRDG